MVGRRNEKVVLVSGETSIQKSNELSLSKLNKGLSLNQMQLLAFAILCTQQNGVTEFQKHEFEKMFNIEKYQTKQAKIDSDKVTSIKFSLDDIENDTFEYMNVFRKMKYSKGKFTFVWDTDMTTHILELKDRYVLTDLTITSKFKSSYSWILYEYLKASYGAWYKTITKESMMKMLGIEGYKTYEKNTNQLKIKILDTAIREINEFTELNVSYEDIKQGKKITGFKLIWSTGTNIARASSKQLEHLISLVDLISQDTLLYAEMKNDDNRKEAMSILREIECLKVTHLVEGTGLKAEFCKKITDKVNKYQETLNIFLEEEGKPQRPKVPLYNWLNG